MNLNENKYFAVKNRKNHDVHLEKRTSFFQLLWRPIIFKILKHWYFLIRKQATVASLKIFDKNLSNLNPNKKSFEKRHLLKKLCQNYIRKVLLTSSHKKTKIGTIQMQSANLSDALGFLSVKVAQKYKSKLTEQRILIIEH